MSYAIVFPGQGSQSVGMMKAYGDLPEVRDVFREASDILHQDIWMMVEEGPDDILNQTINTQPAMLTAGYAVYKAWQIVSNDKRPAYFAGHSLGEYTALVASGALAFTDALPLVKFRAQAMQEAVEEGVGGMAAIVGLDDVAVKDVCKTAAEGQVLQAVNLNAPGQIVIAGHREAVLRGCDLAKTKGAKIAKLLPVSVPSHCSLMEPAATKLRDYLENIQINSTEIPVIQNTEVMAYTDPALIKDALVRQLFSPVRWIETIQYMVKQGVSSVVECGPGKVLGGLNKRIDSNIASSTLHDASSLKEVSSQI